jgi:hypothetical protein
MDREFMWLDKKLFCRNYLLKPWFLYVVSIKINRYIVSIIRSALRHAQQILRYQGRIVTTHTQLMAQYRHHRVTYVSLNACMPPCRKASSIVTSSSQPRAPRIQISSIFFSTTTASLNQKSDKSATLPPLKERATNELNHVIKVSRITKI